MRPIPLILLSLLTPSLALAEDPQLVITRAVADRGTGILLVEGLAFGDDLPAVMLGTSELEVIWADSGSIEAVLPSDVDEGSYLLMVFRGQDVNEYDIFHLAVAGVAKPPEPSTASSARGPQGPPGPAGPPGPPGTAGASSESPLQALAGQRCPDGSILVGFGDDGALDCAPLAALGLASQEPLSVAGERLEVEAGGACAADPSAPTGDFPATQDATVVLASWPATTNGQIVGRLQDREDTDSFALAARESRLGGWCWSSGSDRPLRADLAFRSPGDGTSATVCACWSGEANCDRSRRLCATSVDGVEVTLSLAASMRCRQRDELILDLEITPLSRRLLPNCSTWQLDWSISE